ncbi:ATP-binding protein [Butyrivibrio sp. DSM 10294]|uniref:AAA family ATPase n=1 Tax=Butyrivibrio sp. DSM 10294 TaxID=2972457 RepID=UPI00234E9215|nr:AAA family ATPase [Butyrivibrio sp. DSM 10294]MDC7293393.1 ATP-binding protein [Butyrivibrio sp. DSM 10294]
MPKIIFVSGPCGCGKSTFVDAYARHLVDKDRKTVYVIHGDDFHGGFVEPEDKGDFFVNGEASDSVLWEDILKFNWDCIIATAGRALQQGMDVLIDYVIETELPRVQNLAAQNGAELHYIVLTADEATIEKRIRGRGDIDMIERAKFLKKELEAMPENSGHLYDNSNKTTEETVNEIVLEDYIV